MSQAKTTTTTTAPGDDPGVHFAALAVAMPSAWHSDVIRHARTTARVEKLLKALPATPENGSYVGKVRGLVTALVDLLDGLDADPDLEPTLALFSINREAEADECEIPEDDEPSLGSLDRRMNQAKWCTGSDAYSPDGELDTSDDEPSLGSVGANGDQTLWAVGGRDDREREDDTGIGDLDGLIEQSGGAA